MAHIITVKSERIEPVTSKYISKVVTHNEEQGKESEGSDRQQNEDESVVKNEQDQAAIKDEEYTFSKCDICDLYFTSSEEFALHERSHKMELPYKCGVCGDCFEAIGKLESHLKDMHSHLKHVGKVSSTEKYVRKHRVKKKKKTFLCETCGKNFKRRYQYETHLRSHTGEKPHKCEICGKCYIQKAHLTTHMMSHTGLKPFPCEICGHRFVSNSKLKKHSKVHLPGKDRTKYSQYPVTSDGVTFKCGLCRVTIDGSENYYKHMSEHKQHRPYKCEMCEKSYSRNSDLKSHAETHVGDKQFVCSVCGSAFDTKDLLSTHQEKHVDEKPFECLECGSRFTRRSHLKTHNLRKHTVVKPFVCDVCGKCFGYNSDLKEHSRVHLPVSCICEICGKLYKSRRDVERHKKIHANIQTFVCSECGRTFTHKNFLKIHMNAHARKNKLLEAKLTQSADNSSNQLEK